MILFSIIARKFRKQRKSKYTEILLWAYRKKESGFTWEELKNEFNLNGREEKWIRKIFLTTSDSDRKFFEHFFNDDSVNPNKHYYSLNEKGISAATSYIGSEETRKMSNWAIFISVVSLIFSIIFGVSSGYLTRESNELTRDSNELTRESLMETKRSNELSAKPTISLSVQNEDSTGFIDFGSSTIDFILENTSLTNYNDIDINISLFQTYYDTKTKRLVIRPVAQFWNEDNEIFRSYGFWDNLVLPKYKTNLIREERMYFSLDPSGFINDHGVCPKEEKSKRVYHEKFKYFFRVDVRYKREIDNVNYDYVKYYSISKNGKAVNLNIMSSAFNWIIDENNDGNAIFIVPFKSDEFVRHLDSNSPPYSDFPLESFTYNPIKNIVYLDPTGSLKFETCFMIKAESKNSIDKIKVE